MANNKKSQQVEINTDLAMDIEQILNGGFAPLTTFLDKESLDSVLENMRLPTGEIWPIPILFPKKNNEAINSIDSLLLKFQGHDFAVLDEPKTFEYDLDKLITSFYGTNDEKHPGVQTSMKSPHIFITGKLRGISKLNKILDINYLEPQDVKNIIKENHWKSVVGFHTRNPPHNAHEYIHKSVLKNHDALLLHPVIGSKKKGDFTREAIMRSYELYAEKFLPSNRTVLTPLLTYSRYAGPREAIFTAIVRRNYGCTHFIIGRDHTGVKNFYGKYDSQKIFQKFKDIDIEIIPFSEPFYCKKSKTITTKEECTYGDKYYVEVSGSKIRKAIQEKTEISEIFIKKEILNTLQNMKNAFVD